MGNTDTPTENDTPFYALGFLLVVAGVAWGAFTLGVPPTWIAIGCVILAGVSIMSMVSRRSTTTLVTPTATVVTPTTIGTRTIVDG